MSRARVVRVVTGLGVVLALAAGMVVGTRLIAGGSSPATAAASTDIRYRPAAVSSAFPVGQGNPDLPGKVQPRGNGAPVHIPPGVDGCDRNYADAAGKVSVCVPRVTPEGSPVDCAFLRRVGFPPLVVVGTDGKRLAGSGRPAAQGEVVCAG